MPTTTDISNIITGQKPVSVQLAEMHSDLLNNIRENVIPITPQASSNYGLTPTAAPQQKSFAEVAAEVFSNPIRNSTFVAPYEYAKKYDDKQLGFNAARSFEDQEDMYADKLYSSFGGALLGIGKGVASRGLSIIPKFLSSAGVIGGFTADIFSGNLYNGKLNYTTDNFFLHLMDGIDEGLREVMPIYADKDYFEGGLLSKMGTMKFWADDFFDGVAFAVSSYGNVGLLNAAGKLGRLGKLGKAAMAVEEGVDALSDAERFVQGSETIREAATLSAKEMMQGFTKNYKGLDINFLASDAAKATLKNWAKSGGYATFNTVTEAGAEARDFKKQYKQQLINEGFSESEANDIASEKALNVFNGNIIALLGSNIIEVRTMFPSLFGTTENALATAKRAIVNGEKVATQSLAKTMLKGIGLNIAAEGMYEENIQTSIQQFEKSSSPDNTSFMDMATNSIATMLNNIGYFGSALTGSYKDMSADQKEAVDSIVLGALIGGSMGSKGSYSEHKLLENQIKTFGSQYEGLKNKQAEIFSVLGEDLKNIYKKQVVQNPDGTTTETYHDENGKLVFDEDKIAKLAFLNIENQKLVNEYLYRITNNDKKGADILLDQLHARYAFQTLTNPIWDGDADLALKHMENSLDSFEDKSNPLLATWQSNKERIKEYTEIFKSIQQEQLNKKIDNVADFQFAKFALASMFYEKTKQSTLSRQANEYREERAALDNKFKEPKEIIDENGKIVDNPNYITPTQEESSKMSYLKNQLSTIQSLVDSSEKTINMFRSDSERKVFYKRIFERQSEINDLFDQSDKVDEELKELEKEVKTKQQELSDLENKEELTPEEETKLKELQDEVQKLSDDYQNKYESHAAFVADFESKHRFEGDMWLVKNFDIKKGDYRSFSEQLKDIDNTPLQYKPYLEAYQDMKLSVEFHKIVNDYLEKANISVSELISTVNNFIQNKKDISEEDLALLDSLYQMIKRKNADDKQNNVLVDLKNVVLTPYYHPKISNVVGLSAELLYSDLDENEETIEEVTKEPVSVFKESYENYLQTVESSKNKIADIQSLIEFEKLLKKMKLDGGPVSLNKGFVTSKRNWALNKQSIGYYKTSTNPSDFESPSILLIDTLGPLARFFFERGYILNQLALAQSKFEAYDALSDKSMYTESPTALQNLYTTLKAWQKLIKEKDRKNTGFFDGLSDNIDQALNNVDTMLDAAMKSGDNRIAMQNKMFMLNLQQHFISMGFDLTSGTLKAHATSPLNQFLNHPRIKPLWEDKDVASLTEYDFETIAVGLRTVMTPTEINTITQQLITSNKQTYSVFKSVIGERSTVYPSDYIGYFMLELFKVESDSIDKFKQHQNLLILLEDLKSDSTSKFTIRGKDYTKDEIINLVENLLTHNLNETAILNLNTDFVYKNYLTKLDKYEKTQSIGLSSEQRMSHMIFSKYLSMKINYKPLMLNAVAGSGKTSTFKWLFATNEITAENTQFFATTDTSVSSLQNSLSANNVTVKNISTIDPKADYSNTKHLVVDEIGLISDSNTTTLRKIAEKNPHLKIIFLGDNNQLPKNAIQVSHLFSFQLLYNTPLTLSFRAKVTSISDAFSKFKNKSTVPDTVTLSASGPIGKSVYGVHSVNGNDSVQSAKFDEQIQIEVDNNADILIITSTDKIDSYKKKFPSATVVTPIDAQSLSKDKVFIDVSYADYTSARTGVPYYAQSTQEVKNTLFNTLMYVAISRGSEYVMIKDYDNRFSNTEDTNLQQSVADSIQKSEIEIQKNKVLFQDWIKDELAKFGAKPTVSNTTQTQPQPQTQPQTEPTTETESETESQTENETQNNSNLFEDTLSDTEKDLVSRYPEVYAILKWVYDTKGSEQMPDTMYKEMLSLVYQRLTDEESTLIQSYIKKQSEC